MYGVSKRFGFSASHILHGLGDDHPCSRLHGHNYEIEIMAEAAELDRRGFVVDFRELGDVKRWLDATLDHRHLNDIIEGQPSAEAIARFVYEWCRSQLPEPVAARIVAVRAWETPRAYAEYRA
jgi:6-pyruvoyltetrahydropterin/6-carboxytetrahydropterin synthase